jgi:hypothetical protein
MNKIRNLQKKKEEEGIYGVWCDILSKYGASQLNARATLPNCRTLKENAANCIHF